MSRDCDVFGLRGHASLTVKMFGGKTKVRMRTQVVRVRSAHSRQAPHPALDRVWRIVATHNHFVLDRGGKVFNSTAPVIKLPPEATEDDHLALLGLLNSSTACFWMKQVCHRQRQ